MSDNSIQSLLEKDLHNAESLAALLLRDYCDKAGFGTLYEALQRRLKTCADLTDINGAIVHRSRLSNRHVLDIMQGKSAQSSVYTSQGGTNKQIATRAIAKA